MENTSGKRVGLFSVLETCVDGISRAFAVVSALLLLVTAIMVIIDIALRFSGHPSVYITDYVTYLLVIFVFLCLADGLRGKHHIAADVLTSKMNERMKSLMMGVGLIVTAVISILWAYYFIKWTASSVKSMEHSYGFARMLLWPCKALAAAGVVAFGLMALKSAAVELGNVVKNPWGLSFGKGLNNPVIVIASYTALVILGIVCLKQGSPALGLLVLMLTFLLSGASIAMAILATGLLVLWLVFSMGNANLVATLPTITYDYANKYTLLSLPMFIFAGGVMAKGGLGDKLFDFANVWVRHIRGGLGIAVVIACALFGALSGSSSACCMTIGAIGYPVLVKNGYNRGTAAGLIAVAAGIGIMIPPSNPMIIYGTLTEISIGRLFITGITPGVLLTIFLSAAVVILCRKQDVQVMSKASWKERLITTKNSFFAILMPVIVLGGIYGGIFTITEAAAVAAVYSVLYTILARALTYKEIWKTTVDSVHTVAFIELILMSAAVLQKAVTLLRLPNMLMAAMTNVPGWLFVAIIMLFCIFLGMFIDGASIMVLVVPLVAPLLVNYGFNLYWFGALMVVNDTIGKISPPVGLNLFIVQKLGKLEITEVIRGAVPFILAAVLLLILLCLLPDVVLWLPSHMA